MKRLGCRLGNWLNHDHDRMLLEKAGGEGLHSLRDLAMISVLRGCGLRRAEPSALTVDDMQDLAGTLDLVGKGGHAQPT